MILSTYPFFSDGKPMWVIPSYNTYSCWTFNLCLFSTAVLPGWESIPSSWNKHFAHLHPGEYKRARGAWVSHQTCKRDFALTSKCLSNGLKIANILKLVRFSQVRSPLTLCLQRRLVDDGHRSGTMVCRLCGFPQLFTPRGFSVNR